MMTASLSPNYLSGMVSMIGTRNFSLLASVGLLALTGAAALAQDAAQTQKQVDQIKSVLPEFAIPMREVGDRFQNMYFAAKGGNWALAAYMSKYMNGAMNPASLTADQGMDYKKASEPGDVPP
jgi:hypothetical protein